MTTAMSAPRADEVTDALVHGFFSMAFQPIVEMATGEVHGYESLLRGAAGTPLERPGPLFAVPSPLPNRLIHELDLACIRASLKGGRRLPAGPRLFVNVHGETLWYADRKGHDLFALLEAVGVRPERIVLEISENTRKEHIRVIARALRNFRKLGIRVALDDIGTTEPWIHHLLHLEPDYLKIDRTFVRGIHRNSRRQDLLAGFALLAARLGSRLIAEGVETAAESAALLEVGGILGQGYWFGHPLPVERWITAPPVPVAAPSPVAALYEPPPTGGKKAERVS